MKPSVLLVDEPSIGLEPNTLAWYLKLEDLQKAEKKTIILVEQMLKKV